MSALRRRKISLPTGSPIPETTASALPRKLSDLLRIPRILAAIGLLLAAPIACRRDFRALVPEPAPAESL